jgi:hypothetical protein
LLLAHHFCHKFEIWVLRSIYVYHYSLRLPSTFAPTSVRWCLVYITTTSSGFACRSLPGTVVCLSTMRLTISGWFMIWCSLFGKSTNWFSLHVITGWCPSLTWLLLSRCLLSAVVLSSCLQFWHQTNRNQSTLYHILLSTGRGSSTKVFGGQEEDAVSTVGSHRTFVPSFLSACISRCTHSHCDNSRLKPILNLTKKT